MIILFFLSFIILFWAFIYFYVPKFIVEIKNPIIDFFDRDNYFSDDISSNAEYQTLEFTTNDGLILSAKINYSKEETKKGTFILLHGIRNNRNYFSHLVRELSSLGFDSVALDLRSHGKSEGKYCTFGVNERHDISILIDNLINNTNTHNNIGIWGHSLGGAIALQSLEIDKRINFGVIESTFSDFEEIVREYSRHYIGFNIEPLTKFLIKRSGKIANFNPKHAKPKLSCQKINQPVLLVHGEKDEKISIKNAYDNFDNIKSNFKELIVVPNALHLNVWEIGGREYFKKVYNFIEKNSI